VRVNSDNSSKKMVVLFWTIFALLLFIVFITSNYSISFMIKLHQLSSSKVIEAN
jgi:sensor domain CHASE-containing protein